MLSIICIHVLHVYLHAYIYIYICVCVFESSVLHHHNVTKFSFHFIVLDGAPGTVGTAAPTAAKGLAAAEAAAKRAITARGETIGVFFFCVCLF